MADVPEGGGAPSGVPIIDGTSNAILPDVSEMDRAIGRVSFRKVFGQVASSNADTYFGANMVVAEPPKDPRVSVTITKGQAFDVRADAKSRVESYLAAGPVAAGYLFENHIAGQRAVQLFLHPSDAMPNVGAVLVLRQNEGQPTQKEQFLRVTKVESVQRTFKDIGGKDYQANVVTASISDALRQDYTGSPPSEFFKPANNAARVRETLVADAGSYCGVVPLAQAANLGDFSIKAASIFTQLVPSAQTEVPMAAQLPYADLQTPVQGVADVSYTAAQNWTPALALVLPSPAAPGSININAGAVTDNGAGILMSGGAQFGAVDYANGILTINTGSLNGNKAVAYRPAGFVLRAPRSMESRVTIESRSLSYAGVVAPLPSPGTLSIAYRAQGRWYVLREAGGIIKGSDSSYGAGTYNASSGAYIVTLGALPDVGSSVIFVWGAQADEFSLPQAAIKASQTITLSNLPRLSTLSISWPHENGTDTRTATAAADGTISGDATGTVVGNKVLFKPNKLPPSGVAVQLAFSEHGSETNEYPDTSLELGGQLSVQALNTPLQPGTVKLLYRVRIRLEELLSADEIADNTAKLNVPTSMAVELTDNGTGDMLLPALASEQGFTIVFSQREVGTVNYATGKVIFSAAAMQAKGVVTKKYAGWV